MPASFAGPPDVPRYLVPGAPLLSLCLLSPSVLLFLFCSLLQPLPTSSSWMHHHRAPFSPHLKWASRVIELENATNRRGSSLCHSGQFVSASAVRPRPVMLLCRAARIFLTFWFQPDLPQDRDVLVLGRAALRQQLYPSLPASLTISGGPPDLQSRLVSRPSHGLGDVCTGVTIPTWPPAYCSVDHGSTRRQRSAHGQTRRALRDRLTRTSHVPAKEWDNHVLRIPSIPSR